MEVNRKQSLEFFKSEKKLNTKKIIAGGDEGGGDGVGRPKKPKQIILIILN